MSQLSINRICLGLIAASSLLSLASCSTNKVAAKQRDFDALKQKPWAKKPFQPPKKSGNSFSANNAYSLARASRLVGEKDKGAIATIGKQWGLRHLFVDLRATHSQYLLLGNEQFTILAFRATQGRLGDFVTVLKTWMTETVIEEGPYGELPPAAAGFRESVADCFSGGLVEDIKLFRKGTNAGGAPLFITGHSLGGAMALLARAKLAKEHIPADSLYVFGCPVTVSPIDTNDFRRAFGPTSFYLRYHGDNVPRLAFKLRNMDYTPHGESFEIHRDGSLANYKHYRTLNFASSFVWAVPWLLGAIKTHNLEETYIPSIQRTTRRAQSTLVPQ